MKCWTTGIKNLPDELCNLTELRELDISYNALTSIPANIGEMKNLERLVAAYNKITYLPKSLTTLTNLLSINLRGNALTSLPTNFGQLQSLKEIDLNENPLVRPPKIVCEGGTLTPIVQYLKYAYEKDKKFLKKVLQLIPNHVSPEDFGYFCAKLHLPASDIIALEKSRLELKEKIKEALQWWENNRASTLEPAEALDELIRILYKADLYGITSIIKSLRMYEHAIRF
ncbi:leucine-rich repeat and death domain-containing protein 1-like isoform X1 [Chiloscyllium plagiosum]|uniref:leucine-rich repeat and death domain-containing protein 1-like isoform X1 n=1 Tax=Chiloscyllium plagiosum TaxID=36176 RepID=UPI001CB80700|nr:leucine-rich repeat and death domain-containing protein 1-like isoform X1 [Chiloscyllium plagiosum]